MLERGWLRLNFLTITGERAASYLNFTYNNEMLVYNSGLLPEAYGRLSPGIVLLAWNIRHAIEEGISRFDFLQGDESYKYQMGGRDEAVFNLYARLTDCQASAAIGIGNVATVAVTQGPRSW